MLTHLTITNLALIQNIEIELFAGFSVFTGETGAGKSVLMGAIGLLLGQRAASEHIRSGEESAEVQGRFHFETLPAGIAELLADLELPAEQELVVRRIVRRSGRNRVFINGVDTPLATLRQLGDRLIDLHGQHDHQTLLQEEAALTILDSFKEVKPKRKGYRDAWAAYAVARKHLADHRKMLADLEQKREFLQFQHDEIATLELKPDEESELEKEFAYLSSVTERGSSAIAIESLLEGGGNQPSITAMLTEVHTQLAELQKHDESFKEWRDEVSQASRLFNDLSGTVASYARTVRDESNPARLENINSRLSKIQRLKKKYACDFHGLVAKQEQLAEELDQIFNGDADAQELEKELNRRKEALLAAGEALDKSRAKLAGGFDKGITGRMTGLGFDGGGFQTAFERLEMPADYGLSRPHFLVRTNRGEPFLPLDKTASGGEISRIMLAIKVALAENDPVPILVFDEIDTGVGGKRAEGIAETMVELAAHHQLFVISHLQQIATKADEHYTVYKFEKSGRTITEINRLDDSQRVEEVARMLGGESAAAVAHAKVLLGHA